MNTTLTFVPEVISNMSGTLGRLNYNNCEVAFKDKDGQEWPFRVGGEGMDIQELVFDPNNTNTEVTDDKSDVAWVGQVNLTTNY